LQRRIGEAAIKITGDEIRMVLDLTLKAKNAENRRHRDRHDPDALMHLWRPGAL
jgi:hypothetical protein